MLLMLATQAICCQRQQQSEHRLKWNFVCSRPFVIKEIEQGRLPHHKVGSHRRERRTCRCPRRLPAGIMSTQLARR
jgi:hypothetical protein